MAIFCTYRLAHTLELHNQWVLPGLSLTGAKEEADWLLGHPKKNMCMSEKLFKQEVLLKQCKNMRSAAKAKCRRALQIPQCCPELAPRTARGERISTLQNINILCHKVEMSGPSECTV